ncbi:ARM repeat-containing protein [Schizopora paradoxa]|uniref:ARM repeat-containing protein n=1 Tax=Schizopora paradoxa TaxID=27342 RepID=A0A0H2RPF7_9AGAM|nr:ARM repeat-containing protein [Schizopora paradoxa]
MDPNFVTGLHALLVQSTMSDTVQLKAATAQLNRDYYKNPACISALAQILASSPEIAIRQLSAIELRKRVSQRDYALWIALPQPEREQLKEKLPQVVLNEASKPVRQASARVVAALASHELGLGTWPALLPLLEQCCTSNTVAHREVGSFLLFALLEDGLLSLEGFVVAQPSPDTLSPIMQTLFTLLRGLIADPESADVRVTAVRALGEVAGYMEPDKAVEVATYQALLPAMLKVLESELADAREDGVKKVLDVFETLLVLDVPILSANHVPLLVEFFLKAGGEESREPDLRVMALNALGWSIKYKKSKIQSTNLAPGLLNGLLPIVASLTQSEQAELDGTAGDDDGDDDLEDSPSRTALRIIDTIATVLPPSQVIPPLLQIATAYMADPSRDKRRAALLALGVSVEGCSEYMGSAPASGASGSGSGQSLLDSQVWPLVEAGLRDGDSAVRRAACTSVGCLCEWLEEACTSRHATLLPALMTLAGRGQRTQREACVALDAFLEVLPEDIIGGYLAELLTALIGLLEDDASSAGASDRQRKARTKVKSTVVGAIGSAAHAAKGKFVQYFEETMRRMEPFLILGKNQTEETTPVYEAEVELRGIAMDAVGTFSEAVGKDTFRPYLPQMMRQAFEGLEMGSARLRECSFLFFGVMARVFGEEFALGGKEQGGEGWLAGAVAALVKSLQQEEKNDGGLGEDAKVAAELFGTGEVSSKSAAGPSTPAKKAPGATDTEADVDVEDLDGEEGDAVLEVNSAIAVEKEIAADTVGTLFAATGVHFLPYVEQCVLELIQLLDHYYEGIRKSSVESILEIVRTFNSLGEPVEWAPGLPGKEGTGALHKNVKDLVGHCLPALLELYESEDDKSVVSTLCVGLAETINSLGPAFLEGRLDVISDIAIQILEQKALCQQDPDQDEDDEPLEDQAEFDSVLISSADDLVASLANVLGGDFTTAFQRFFPLISKFYKKGRSLSDRSSAIGCLAEIISGMKGAISPSTQPLLELFYQALSDEADEVQSNAAFATGLLVEHSTVDLTPQYMHLLQALRPLFDVPSDATAQRLTGRDNAVGAVSRLIARNTAAVPLGQVLPPLLAALPLRHDFLENRPLFRCIFHLFRVAPQELVPYLDQLLPVFAHVLNPETSEDQLGTETRAELLNLVTALNGQDPAKVQAAGLGPFVQGA